MNKQVEEFGWSEEEKEYYFTQAEHSLDKVQADEEIDREKFKISPDGVTVFLKPFRKGTKKSLNRWNQLKKIKGFGETYMGIDGSKRNKMYHGQIKIPWKKQA